MFAEKVPPVIEIAPLALRPLAEKVSRDRNWVPF